LLSAFAVPVFAQEEASPLDALLERISFDGAESPETLGEDLASLSKDDVAGLCDMLVEQGTGDDTKARMALHALALHIGSQAPETGGQYVDWFCAALKSDKPPSVKSFLIEQIRVIGGRKAAPTLRAFLEDDELCAPAIRALALPELDAAARIETGSLLIDALTNATGRNRIAIINALRDFPFLLTPEGAPSPIPALLKDANSDDAELRIAALSALAASGELGLTDTLLGAAATGSTHERVRVTAYIFEYAERLAKKGHKQRAARIYEEMLRKHTDPSEIHVRCAALDGFARLRGADAVRDVVAALTAENPEFRAAATGVAVTLAGDGITAAYVSELKAASAEVKVGILGVLGARGDAVALPAALGALEDESQDVRIAAVSAAAKLGGANAIGPLVAFLATAQDGEREAATRALVAMPGDAVSARLAAALKPAPPAVRVTLLDVLARRRAHAQLVTIFVSTIDDNEDVRIAAVNAIGALADAEAAPRLLLGMLKRAASEDERNAIEQALAATCARSASPAMRAVPIIKAIDREKVRDYCSLLRVLGQLGGQQALATLSAGVRDERAEVKEAALRGLGDLPEPKPAYAADVLELAAGVTEVKQHVLGMRAFAQLLARVGGVSAGEKLELYRAGMDVARRVEEQKLLLSGIGDVKDAAAFDVLAKYLSDEALRSEAGSAMIGVARGILPVGWSDARAALEQVLEKVDDQRVHRHAEDVMKEVERYADFVTAWQVAGPYTTEGKNGPELFDIAYDPEQPDATDVQWKDQPIRENDRYWFIDLDWSLGGDNCAGYLRTYVWSPQAQEALLELGSDDALKVWVNEALVHGSNVPRGCAPGQDQVTVKFSEGWNTVLLKVVDFGGGWAACLRVRAPGGERLDGLKYARQARP
jgi:HEAT repeat protein